MGRRAPRVLRALGMGLAIPVLAGASALGGVTRPTVADNPPVMGKVTDSGAGVTISTPVDGDQDVFAAVLPVNGADGDGTDGEGTAAVQDVSGAPDDALAELLTQDGHPVDGNWEFVDDEGETSEFHVATNGVDFAEPWGVLFWFEGDGTATSASTIPDSSRLSALAQATAARNMVLVVPDSPDTGDPLDVTWWENAEDNGVWFRGLESVLADAWNADATRVWFAGYSGGADFISTELLPSGNDWIMGGGAVMMGGGESLDIGGTHTAAMTGMPLTWFVGSEDGEIDSEDWSPLKVATQGEAAWRRAGFTDTSLVVLPGLGHTDYDPSELVGRALDAAGVTG